MTTAIPDISQLDYNQLRELRDAIDARTTEMQDAGRFELKARFVEAAAAYGLSIDEIMGTAKRKRRRRLRHRRAPLADDETPSNEPAPHK